MDKKARLEKKLGELQKKKDEVVRKGQEVDVKIEAVKRELADLVANETPAPVAQA